ncbi:MAG: hypothetical protein HQL84_00910 [Magnetococcales bacterium]|nr:hypothetical protein [Magnetococcales bacterium]MBF0148589.1 hypothetical protein [Magnetococcales bacterium]MBF0172281.1 hypothetical protein [Magnetococcales bacterium]MBF0629718.1 hypothetical protein [Magnetococcales bacterium]
MARGDEEEPEGFEDSEEHESDLALARRKKVIFIVLGVIFLEIVTFAVYKVFFKAPGDEAAVKNAAEQIMAEEQLARKTVLRGQWIAKNIPDLPPVPYKPIAVSAGSKSGGKRGISKNMAPSLDGLDSESSEEDAVERTSEGDIVFSVGETKWVGPKGEGDGVVVVDRLRVGVDTFGNRVIRGRIANQGHQSLAQVEVTVEFTEAGGAIVQSRRVNPLVVSGGLFGDRVQTLKPGDSRMFQLDATDLPDSWTGSVATRIDSHHFVP